MKSAAETEIKRAAQLSVTEICLGSLGHGFKIPLTGQILSMNQLGFLLNAVNRDELPRSSVFEISGIAAILKSFSPAGQKLGPMLSIAMQGFLFWFGMAVLGTGMVGQIAGALLLSAWAFIQPLVTLFIVYGYDVVTLTESYRKDLEGDYAFLAATLVYAVAAFVILKFFIAAGLVILSRKFKKEIRLIKEEKIGSYLKSQMPSQSRTPLRAALGDLVRPWFLLSFVLMMIFVWQVKGPMSGKIWLSLRPLAIAFVLFYVLRSPWVAQKLMELSKKSKTFERLYLKSRAAMEIVAERVNRG